MRRLWLLGSLVCGSLVLHACGGGSSMPPPPPPPQAAQLKVTSSLTATAGTALQVTVTAVGTNGAVASTYTGTVHFTSTDKQASLPADSTLTNGTKTFSVTLKTSNGQYVNVTDTVAASITGTCGINVNPGPTTQLIATPAAPIATSGFALNVAVGAQDAYGNVATNYAGTVKITSSDAQATLPPNGSLTNGYGNFPVTLKTLGSQTVTATDIVTASLTNTSGAINVVSNKATHLAVTGTPGSISTRKTFGFTVSALDDASNVSAGYSGTVQFSSSDGSAKLPANSTLTAGNANFSATMETAGTQTLTATDTSNASLTSSSSITVNAAASLSVSSSPPPAGTVGKDYDPRQVKLCVAADPFTGECTEWQTYTKFGFPLGGSGGVPPYTWTWAPASGSSLPANLIVANPQPGPYAPGCIVADSNGDPVKVACIGGTPTQPDTFNVNVTVTDSGNPSAQASTSYSITIAKPTPPSVSGVSPTPALENQPYSFAFSIFMGYPPFTWSESGALPAGLSFDDNTGTISGTPTQAGSFPISVTATDQFSQSSQSRNFTLAVYAHGFVAVGNMTAPRALHTSTLLNGGKVLITGGTDWGNPPTVTPSAELYDPNAGTFSAAGNMQTPRFDHTATLLNDGRVLIAGGCSIVLTSPWSSAELYDSAGATSTATASMKTARCGHTATLLASGKVLMVGGFDSTSTSLASAELFDPATNTFSSTGSLHTARKEHTATLLTSGKVLVTGGIDDKSNDLDTAELYDPTSGTFTTVVGMMTAPRAGHTATIFTSGVDAGKVLLAGGVDATGNGLNTAELFDPTAQSFTATNNMTSGHAYYAANLLPDGTVLLAGGVDATGGPTSVAELFDPSSGNFSATGNLTSAREQHASTLLANGQVLATGGQNGRSSASAEVYK